MSQNSENAKIVHQNTTAKTVYVKKYAIFWCKNIYLNNNLIANKCIYNQKVNINLCKSILCFF